MEINFLFKPSSEEQAANQTYALYSRPDVLHQSKIILPVQPRNTVWIISLEIPDVPKLITHACSYDVKSASEFT